jgi:hypothetical protein
MDADPLAEALETYQAAERAYYEGVMFPYLRGDLTLATPEETELMRALAAPGTSKNRPL